METSAKRREEERAHEALRKAEEEAKRAEEQRRAAEAQRAEEDHRAQAKAQQTEQEQLKERLEHLGEEIIQNAKDRRTARNVVSFCSFVYRLVG